MEERKVTPAQLRFLGYEVLKVVFTREGIPKNSNFHVELNETMSVHSEQKNLFRIGFIITITHREDKTFNLIVQVHGSFETIGEPDKTLLDNFTSISAPAILYPYVRAFISNLMVQSGMPPVFIPPVNFGTLVRTQVDQRSAPSEDDEAKQKELFKQ